MLDNASIPNAQRRHVRPRLRIHVAAPLPRGRGCLRPRNSDGTPRTLMDCSWLLRLG